MWLKVVVQYAIKARCQRGDVGYIQSCTELQETGYEAAKRVLFAASAALALAALYGFEITASTDLCAAEPKQKKVLRCIPASRR